jgi:hypothetical protein
MNEKTLEQTAAEWLFEKLWETPKDKFTWYLIFGQAKQMEKKQIEDAIDYCRDKYINSENYYNETYGK